MKVWVSTFGLYSNGYLLGYWVDAEDAPETVSEFRGYLIGQGHKLPVNFDSIVGDELWCFDTEGFPPGVGEMNPAEARQWASVTADMSDEEREDFILYCDDRHLSPSSDDAVMKFEDDRCGRFDSFRDFVEEWVAETMNIPEHLESYIDWDAVARDYEPDFTEFDVAGGGIVVFRNS